MERFKGRKFLPASRSKSRRPRISAEPSRKIAFTFLDFARTDFLEGKGNFLRGRPPLCGG